MASSRLLEREVSAAAKLGFCPHKHSLLIIIGRTARLSRTQLISRELEAGKNVSMTAAVGICLIQKKKNKSNACKLWLSVKASAWGEALSGLLFVSFSPPCAVD